MTNVLQYVDIFMLQLGTKVDLKNLTYVFQCFFFQPEGISHDDAVPPVPLFLCSAGPVMLPYGSNIITEPGGP